ncbi:hypothetical protein FKM82_026250 [Ascaphus truei]
MKMKFMKAVIVILIEVSYIFVNGAVIEPHQNEVFPKTTNELAAVGEGYQYEDKKVFTAENHIIGSPRGRSVDLYISISKAYL